MDFWRIRLNEKKKKGERETSKLFTGPFASKSADNISQDSRSPDL